MPKTNPILTSRKGRFRICLFSPGAWGESLKGVFTEVKTQNKHIALTFDACGGKNGNGYDSELTGFLRKEKIPATFFISGKWIDANFYTFLDLSSDSLFEIENHGLNHRPCSIDGKSAYGIRGTSSAAEAFEEIEANARKIEYITKHSSRYYRSSTCYMDETCVLIANKIGIIPVSYSILSGDGTAYASALTIKENVISKVRPGGIIIMHLNHPEWNTYEALLQIIPVLRSKGYKFVRLEDLK